MIHDKKVKLNELSQVLNGQIKGNSHFEIEHLSEPNNFDAKSLVMVKNSKKWIKQNIKVEDLPGCIVVQQNALSNYKGNQIIVENYDKALIKILNYFNLYSDDPEKSYISDKASIHTQANSIGEKTTIYDFVTVGEGSKIGSKSFIGCNTYIGRNVRIGSNVKIYQNCTLYDYSVVEDNVLIMPGAVIGADGFGYVEIDNKTEKIPQIGNVIINKNAEIGANTCIDRATIGSTVIGENTKIDNLCQIAHNVKIGDNCIIVSQTGISGSCNIGNNCIIGGQVGIADHVTIEAGTVVGSQSGITKSSYKQSGYLLGTPAKEMMREHKIRAFLNKSPEILDRIKKLESRKTNL